MLVLGGKKSPGKCSEMQDSLLKIIVWWEADFAGGSVRGGNNKGVIGKKQEYNLHVLEKCLL